MSEVSSVSGPNSPSVLGYQKAESDAGNVKTQEVLRQNKALVDNDSVNISRVALSRVQLDNQIAQKIDTSLSNQQDNRPTPGEPSAEVAKAKMQRLRSELEGLKTQARFGDQEAARAAARAAAQVAREMGAIDSSLLQAPVGPSEARALLAVQVAGPPAREPTPEEIANAEAGFAPLPADQQAAFNKEQTEVIDSARFIVEHSNLRDGVSLDDPQRPDYAHLLKEVDTAGNGNAR